MNRYVLVPALVAAASIVACAAVEPQQSAATGSSEVRHEKTYVTGSRIPVRDSTGSAEVRSIQSKEGVDDMMQGRSTITTAPKHGGM